MRPVGVDALAAIAVNAGPPRTEPGEVAAEYLGAVGRIGELHEGAGEADQHFWHARQCMPETLGLGLARARSRFVARNNAGTGGRAGELRGSADQDPAGSSRTFYLLGVSRKHLE